MHNDQQHELARSRFPQVLQYVKATRQQYRLLDTGVAPHRMAFTRWGKSVPPDEVIWAIVRCLFGDRAEQLYTEGSEWFKLVTLPPNIGTLRRSLKLTQAKVAKAIGVSRFTLNKAEQGDASRQTIEAAWTYLWSVAPSRS